MLLISKPDRIVARDTNGTTGGSRGTFTSDRAPPPIEPQATPFLFFITLQFCCAGVSTWAPPYFPRKHHRRFVVLVRKSYARLSLVAALNLGSTSESAVMLMRNCSTLCGSIASREITDFAREFMITTPLFMELEGF